ncbi:MAG: hypothetical protein H0U52_11770 [Chloroflexi bacterium]|nr:hypothetical protein [Chloroflexota bacterium]
MSGTTRTVQQPLNFTNFVAVMAMAAVVLAATIAIAWGATNVGKAAPAALPAPAAISEPGLRDLGARDTGAAIVGTSLGAPGAYRVPATSGSLPGYLGHLGYGASGGSSTLTKDDNAFGSNTGAPAIRHPGLRAQ